MDTRTKIADAEAFRGAVERWRHDGLSVIVARGHFDPLLAAHATRLSETKPAGDKLAVIVAERDGQILDSRSRAELVAALRCVDLVAIDAAGLPVANLRFEEADSDTAREFESHVVERMS